MAATRQHWIDSWYPVPRFKSVVQSRTGRRGNIKTFHDIDWVDRQLSDGSWTVTALSPLPPGDVIASAHHTLKESAYQALRVRLRSLGYEA